MAYAVGTSVPVEKTKSEIERMVTSRYKCEQYSTGTDYENGMAMVQFKANGRIVRFMLQLPDPNDKQWRKPKRGQWSELPATSPIVRDRIDQAAREKWRGLLLVVKAKLEAVETGIATFEEEFLAHIVMPNGRTLGTMMLPVVEQAYVTGQMPPQLLLAETTGEHNG